MTFRRLGRNLVSRSVAANRSIAAPAPWPSSLPPPGHAQYAQIGRQIVQHAAALDTGKDAFAEVFVCRRQLEAVVRACGYDMTIFTFGGVNVMGMLEVGGDVDFAGITDIEPSTEEASEIIARICREVRRLGLRATAVPKARVPVGKVERVSRAPPGTPPHALASTGVFQLVRPLLQSEADAFTFTLKQHYFATNVEWNSTLCTVTASFRTTTELVEALSRLKRHGAVEIPIRQPLNPKLGPEMYRYPFDLCLTSVGLRNSQLLGHYLGRYTYGRHLLLMVKRWGRAAGVVNTLDGLLASYALTVMCVHFLGQLDVIPLVDTSQLLDEPQLLCKELPYRPLAGLDGAGADMGQLGYLFTKFFEYYATVFNWSDDVICTTHKRVSKALLRWDSAGAAELGRPPFFFIGMKDPYGLDNIARNVDATGAAYIASTFRAASELCVKHMEHPAEDLVETMVASPPRLHAPPVPLYLRREHHGDATVTTSAADSEQLVRDSTLHQIKRLASDSRRDKVTQFGRSAVHHSSRNAAASEVAKSMTSWLKSDAEKPPPSSSA